MTLRRLKRNRFKAWDSIFAIMAITSVIVGLIVSIQSIKVSTDTLRIVAERQIQTNKQLLEQNEQLLKEVEKLNEENQELKKQASLPTTVKVASYIKYKFGDRAEEANRVAKCESGLRIDATNRNTNGTGDFGLFQINSIHTKRFGSDFMTDWQKNIDVAHALYSQQGWQPWYPSAKCHGLLVRS